MPRGTMYKYPRKRTTVPLNRLQKKQVKRIANSGTEYKIFNNNTNSSISQTGLVVPIFAGGSNGPAQGAGDSERIGDKISLEQIFMNVSAYIPSGGDLTNYIRMIIFQWKDRTIPVGTDILVTSTDYLGLHNYDRRQQYNVLVDKTISLSFNGPAAKFFNINLKRKFAKQMTYVGTEVQKNGVYAYIVSDSGAVVHPVITWRSRAYYTDK